MHSGPRRTNGLSRARRFYEAATGPRPVSVLRGAKYLLSGLAACASCGGAMIVRSRASTAGRRFVYGCGYHHTRGPAVCANTLLAPMDVTNAAVVEAIDRDVLNPRVLGRAVAYAIAALCPPPEVVDVERASLLGELRRLEEELERLAEAIAAGGDAPALLRAVKDREARRTACEQRLAALESTRRLGRMERARIDPQVHELLTDWQGLLHQETPQAREVLRNVLDGRLIFAPDLEQRVYVFTGEPALGRMLAGIVPGYSGVEAFNSGRGPKGIWHTDVLSRRLTYLPFDGLARAV